MDEEDLKRRFVSRFGANDPNRTEDTFNMLSEQNLAIYAQRGADFIAELNKFLVPKLREEEVEAVRELIRARGYDPGGSEDDAAAVPAEEALPAEMAAPSVSIRDTDGLEDAVAGYPPAVLPARPPLRPLDEQTIREVLEALGMMDDAADPEAEEPGSAPKSGPVRLFPRSAGLAALVSSSGGPPSPATRLWGVEPSAPDEVSWPEVRQGIVDLLYAMDDESDPIAALEARDEFFRRERFFFRHRLEESNFRMALAFIAAYRQGLYSRQKEWFLASFYSDRNAAD